MLEDKNCEHNLDKQILKYSMIQPWQIYNRHVGASRLSQILQTSLPRRPTRIIPSILALLPTSSIIKHQSDFSATSDSIRRMAMVKIKGFLAGKLEKVLSINQTSSLRSVGVGTLCLEREPRLHAPSNYERSMISHIFKKKSLCIY